MRRADRELRDPGQIRALLDRAGIVHLGLTDGDRPYVVPMHYGYRLEEGRLTLYLHCAREGRKLELIERNPAVFVEIDDGAVLLSGGDEPCRYGAAYASLMGEGSAQIVDDPEEKRLGLTLLMKAQTGRDFEIPAAATDSVCVLRIDILSFTAKARPLP